MPATKKVAKSYIVGRRSSPSLKREVPGQQYARVFEQADDSSNKAHLLLDSYGCSQEYKQRVHDYANLQYN